MKKVLIPTKLERVAKDVLEAHGGYKVVQDDKTPLPELVKQHPDVYALIVRSEKVTAAVLDALPKLKVVVRAGAGYDTIDTKHARSRNVDVMNTPGANSNAVAEEVIAMVLADMRFIAPADASTRVGKWEKKAYMGRELTGKTVGIVGLGNIGQLLAKRLKGFDCKLIGYDPLIAHDRAQSMDVELVDLEALFEKADVVTLHLPETPETRRCIDLALLSRMKEGAILVNCARSGVLDEDALRKVKAEKKLRFLNDVYPEDKEGPKSVTDIADIMLPHLGASTVEANTNAARRAAEELIEYDDKGITSFVVNRDIPAGLDKDDCDLAYTITRLCRHLVGAGIQLKLIETSFYGALEPYAEWLLLSVARALCERVDASMDVKSCGICLKEMGLEVINRVPDPAKAYENSITIDITGSLGADQVRRASVRGTIAEGIMMISRVNDFDRLYFEPRGPAVFFLYEDRPGVLGQIGTALAAANINIEDVRNPHHPRMNQSLAIMRVNKPVPELVLKRISKSINALASYYYDFSS